MSLPRSVASTIPISPQKQNDKQHDVIAKEQQ
jgi:hypothetical protein